MLDILSKLHANSPFNALKLLFVPFYLVDKLHKIVTLVDFALGTKFRMSCVNSNRCLAIDDHADSCFETSIRISACRNDLLKDY